VSGLGLSVIGKSGTKGGEDGRRGGMEGPLSRSLGGVSASFVACSVPVFPITSPPTSLSTSLQSAESLTGAVKTLREVLVFAVLSFGCLNT